MLSLHLAELYGVEARVLIQAVKRNSQRFPADFLFRLSPEEFAALRSQIVILEKGRGRYPKYPPYAFTEQGVARRVSSQVAEFRTQTRQPRCADYRDRSGGTGTAAVNARART